MNFKKIQFSKLILSILLAQTPGIIGAFFTSPQISGWYSELAKPALNPPSWLFGPVWIILYTLIGISFYLLWTKSDTFLSKLFHKSEYHFLIIFFFIHLAINGLWSVLFFGIHDIALALADLLLIVITLIVLIARLWKLQRTAAYLLIPYFLWVCFATYLNYSIWQLNLL